jgi:hypothetical protein
MSRYLLEVHGVRNDDESSKGKGRHSTVFALLYIGHIER